MIFTTSAMAILVSAFFGSANAHMVMSQPLPYNFQKITSSPLASLDAFPCQGPIDSTTPATAAQAGGDIKVKFGGTAVHGGGTCQFSVTYENPPPKDPSKWKVIHTVVGGCPVDAPGNFEELRDITDSAGRPAGIQCDDNSTVECLPTFSVPVLKDIKNGDATFAWTWFNAIGNREMYMNCAPITITGGKDDDSGMADLPSMFMANVGNQPCTTENGVLDLTGVGGSVQTIKNPIEGSLGSCKVSGGGGGAGDAVTPAPPAESSSPDVSAPAPSATPSNPGNAFAPAEPPTTPAPVTPPPQSQPESPAPSGGNSIPCSPDGVVICMGASQFGMCSNGFATPGSVAAGTICVNGVIVAAPIARKRHVDRHLRLHPRSFI